MQAQRSTRRPMALFGMTVLVACLACLVCLACFCCPEAQARYGEAPMLRRQAARGELPEVAQRLPRQPLVVQPHERVGQYGGVWRMALRGNRDHALLLRTLGYENLVRWSPTWQRTVPNIAAAVIPNAEYTAYTFLLRQGMRWSDGHPFTADDILFWYEDVLSNPTLTPAPPPWLVAGGRPVVVEKLNDYTVVFRFSVPYGLFLQQLAHPQGAEPTSYPRHYLAQFHPRHAPEAAARLVAEEDHADWAALFTSRFGTVGNIDNPSRWRNHQLPTLHAWVLDQDYTPDARKLTATRNPYYWKIDPMGNQLPYIDHLFFRVGDKDELEAWALAGELDMQNRHIAGEVLLGRLEDAAATGRLRLFHTTSGRSSQYCALVNLTHKDPATRALFQDLRFRQALSYALDRDQYAQTTSHRPGQPYQAAPRPESIFYNDRLATQYVQHNPARAKALLDELGCRPGPDGWRTRPDGTPLRLTLLTEAPYLEAHALLADMWRAVGLQVQAEGLDREAYYAKIMHNDHDVAIAAGEGGLDVLVEHQHYLPVHEECFFGVGWRHWLLDPSHPLAQEPPAPVKRQLALYDQLKSTGDPEAQAALMRQILDIAAEEFFAIGLNLDQEGVGVVSLRMRNVPQVMPYAWSYPTPAPTNPCQYYYDNAAPQRP